MTRTPWVNLLIVLATCVTGVVGCDDGPQSISTAQVVLTPDSFRFGKLAIGADADRVVQVENIGNGQLIVANVRMELDNADEEFELYWKTAADDPEFVGINRQGDVEFQFPIRVNGGDSLFLVLNYQAVREEPVGGTIILETNLPENPEVRIPVILAEGSPEINVSPQSHDFDRVPAGETAETTIQVSNVGQLDLEVSRVLLNGSQDFKPLIEVDGDLRDPRQVAEPLRVLAPNESFEITVRYSPAVEGPDTAELTVFSNDPNRPEVAVTLSANGATPCLRVNPPALEFRTSLVNRTDSRPMSLESWRSVHRDQPHLSRRGQRPGLPARRRQPADAAGHHAGLRRRRPGGQPAPAEPVHRGVVHAP